MKKIEAIIRMNKFEAVKKALANIGVRFFTVHDVRGFGLQKGETLIYRGSEYGTEYIERIQMDIFATNDKYQEIINVILNSGTTGRVGDGKIVVFPLDTVYRIRNGEQQELAL